MQNEGAFNDIVHYHLHIFPSYEKNGFGWIFLGKEFKYSQEVADKIAGSMIAIEKGDGCISATT